jgi:chromosome segregation protein
MYLKSLTMKGFKSFAGKSELAFEPGTTVIVGPNGSGKSNIVDAFLWVTGEQSARSLRSSKMQDVIFAGSAGKSPMGLAEVSLNFDNTARVFPVDYDEVSFARRLYRSGESEYSLNGNQCRLADLNELLTHTNMGREMYSIVGQGRLDAILNSRPDERRVLIEEAAGLAKYKRRKEKALRKLAATERNLVRVGDILAEIKRQLKPLETQAKMARDHKKLVDELRASEVEYIVSELNELNDKKAALKKQTVRVGKELSRAKEQAEKGVKVLALLEEGLAEISESVENIKDRRYKLTADRERLHGRINLLKEKEANARLVGEAFVDELSDLAGELKAISDKTKTIKSEIAKAEKAIAGSEKQDKTVDPVILKAEADSLNGRLAVVRARIETEESFLPSKKAGARQATWPSGIKGYLSDLVAVKPGYETAAEALLGLKISAVVATDSGAARKLIGAGDNWPAVIIGTLRESSGSAGKKAPAGSKRMTEYVENQGLDEKVFESLFATSFLIDSLANAIKLAGDKAYANASFVTSSGETLTGGVASPKPASAADAMARQRRLAELKNQAEKLAAEEKKTLTALNQAEEKAAKREKIIKPLREEIAAKQARLRALIERETLLKERLEAAGAKGVRPAGSSKFNAADLKKEAGMLGEARKLAERLKALIDKYETAAAAKLDKAREEERKKRAEILAAQIGLAELEKATALLEQDAHREEITEAQLEPKISTLTDQLKQEFGLSEKEAFGAHPATRPRDELAGRMREIRVKIEYMGPVNPIAAEEFEETQKRQEHLEAQTKDLRRSERSLHKVIGLMDRQMGTKFMEIFEEVNASFQDVFLYMFPDGKAQLLLTDPDDLLATGIEIEAQPSGRRLKKVSLLSGGESAMTALALLFALFQINPAPFYILDEADVALDDVNLQRFVALINRYKDKAQFLVVTHQRRTMDVADILYGVTMQKDGMSRVLSQKLAEA